MHVFQPMTEEMLECNPFTMIGKDWMLITAGDENKANTMTASWGGFGVLWGKDVVYIFVRDSRYTKEFIDKKDSFSLSFFNNQPKGALKYLGAVSGRDEDKITNAGFNVNYHDGVPFIDEANIVVICKKLSATRIIPEQFIEKEIDEKWYSNKDYHTMYVGEITQFMAR